MTGYDYIGLYHGIVGFRWLGGLTQENSRIEVREEFIYFYFVYNLSREVSLAAFGARRFAESRQHHCNHPVRN